jgi:hypothetical protein
MAQYTLPHFGDIDLTNLDEYYDVDITFNDHDFQIDLNFENKTIDAQRLDKVKEFIEKIAELDAKNKVYIEEDYTDEEADTVKTYVQHHLEEIDREALAALVDFENKTIDPEKQLVKQLHLIRMGLYPDSEDQFAIFDYSIGAELTNYLVVINTDEEGNLEYMTMES